jgi:DNA-binding response OmpR family regulator
VDEEFMAKNILVVDDEKRILSLLEAYLEQQGFLVTTATNGKEAIFIARHEKPDLIILDIMMPEMDGYEFMRQHRKERETPIILLTAKVEEDDKVIGLELGADDYVTKPFSPRELTSRVRAVLRRTGQDLPHTEVLRLGGVTLDRDSHMVTVDEAIVDLTPSEFDLLAVLMSSPGRTFTRLELLDQIQDTAFIGYERTIDVHIKNLRAKLEDNPRQPRYIETVYGIGYRFTAR